MARPAGWVSMVVRSLSIQASWNYKTLLGTGFAFVLTPLLRRVYASDSRGFREALRRHVEVFNSHPYLSTLAVGAVARLEEEGADEELIRRFKSALRGSLGSLGDQMFWVAWRPMCALLAITLLIVGVPWWIALLAFLGVYNALHLGFRIWGIRAGYETGLELGRTLRSPHLFRWADGAKSVGALLAGFCAVVSFSVFQAGTLELLVAALAIVAGLLLGYRVRTGVGIGLVLVLIGDLIIRGIA